MKGEIIRRMSMEIIKDEVVERDPPVKKNEETNKAEDEDDYLVKTIGVFGLWQAIVSVTVSLTRAIAIWNMMSISFLTPVLEFSCVEFSDNVTIGVTNSVCYDNCMKYNYSSSIGRSIIEDFGLICQNAWMASLAQSVMMMASLVGAYLFGWISDRSGRRTALLISTFMNAVFMIALPFSPNYTLFTSIRFMIGIATGGSLLICVVLVMEIIGKRQREIAGACILIPDGLAQASLAGFAYFTANWQGYTLSYGIAACFIFVLILFVPESPRWLLAHGKVDEAIKVITRAAKRNNLDTSNIQAEVTRAAEDMKLKDGEITKTSYIVLFTNKTLCLHTIIVFILWLTFGLCFYGIFQYMTIIGFDLYMTVVILGLVEIPICPVCIIVIQRFGRKSSIIGTSIGIAIAMLTVIFIPKGFWPVTLLGVVGFIFNNICFSIAYIYVSELYPTPLRNMSYGLTSSGAKIGATIAPFIANLSPDWIPSLVFCIFAVVGGLCCLSLPETKGQNLKDTIEK